MVDLAGEVGMVRVVASRLARVGRIGVREMHRGSRPLELGTTDLRAVRGLAARFLTEDRVRASRLADPPATPTADLHRPSASKRSGIDCPQGGQGGGRG